MSSVSACASAVKHTLLNLDASIESVASVDGDGVLVRVNKASEGLVDRLREQFPLAIVALSEDLIGSTACANVLFPSDSVQREHAFSLARGRRLPRVLLFGSNCFLLMAVIVLAVSIAAGMRPSP
jgi:hypothetical protein